MNGIPSNLKTIIRRQHRLVSTCFMTGKGCAYSESINRVLTTNLGVSRSRGFIIMPFRPNIENYISTCLIPFFEQLSNDDCIIEVKPADQGGRPGIIVCEGICRKIQESDFVIADISLPNANVLYELGLAYGIGHKIIIVHHHAAPFGKDLSVYFNNAGYPTYQYYDLSPIQLKEAELINLIWNIKNPKPDIGQRLPYILFFEYLQSEIADSAVGHKDEITQDVIFPFAAHIISDIRLSIEHIINDIQSENSRMNPIYTHLDRIKNLALPVNAIVSAPFEEIQRQVENSYCTIFRTGKDCNPMTYFWLGYAHGRGRNAIPITTLQTFSDAMEDLAFDIRSLRHMTFVSSSPQTIRVQLEHTLKEMIIDDFSEWSKNHFWNHILSPHGEVHMFTGAVHNSESNREMVGDWDLRTVSELTSYLTQHQYRCKIESPVYGPERIKTHVLSDYINLLYSMLKGKNCILLGSPDVNPLTELILGRIYKIPEEHLFGASSKLNENYPALFVIKEKVKIDNFDSATTNRTLSNLIAVNSLVTTNRGFKSKRLPGGTLISPHIGLGNKTHTFHAYAHLMIVKNPFDYDDSQSHFIIILNGSTGAATFALAHALTAGIGIDFTAYDVTFDPKTTSENFLRQLLNRMLERNAKGVECIIKVIVGPSKHDERSFELSAFDWRRVISWSLADNAFDPPIVLIE